MYAYICVYLYFALTKLDKELLSYTTGTRENKVAPNWLSVMLSFFFYDTRIFFIPLFHCRRFVKL